MNHPQFTPIAVDNVVFRDFIIDNYSHLPLGDEIKQISGTNINSSNYTCDNYYIKLVPKTSSSRNVQNMPFIANTLLEGNVPVAKFIKNKHGDDISIFNDPNSEISCYLYLQEMIEGSFYNGSKEHLLSSFSLLSKLKKINIRALENMGYIAPYLNWNPTSLLLEIERIIQNKRERDVFDDLSYTMIPAIRNHLLKFETTIKKITQRESDLNHYDLHPHNLLLLEDKVRALIDLESFVLVPFELSEAFAIFKLGRKSISLDKLTVSEFRKECLNFGFNLTSLFPFVVIELIRRIAFIMDLHYLKNLTTWDEDLYKHIAGLEESKRMFL